MDGKTFLGNRKSTDGEGIHLKAGTPIFLGGFRKGKEGGWGGGHIYGDNVVFSDFKSCFLDPTPTSERGHPLGKILLSDSPYGSLGESVDFFLDETPYNLRARWDRLKELFLQFYALRNAAKVLREGGGWTSRGQTTHELNPSIATSIDNHLLGTTISEICHAVAFLS